MNARDYRDCTPLMHAAGSAAQAQLEILMKQGADIYARNRVGSTCIAVCRPTNGCKEAIKNFCDKHGLAIPETQGEPLLGHGGAEGSASTEASGLELMISFAQVRRHGCGPNALAKEGEDSANYGCGTCC